jgi:hypothetical protein
MPMPEPSLREVWKFKVPHASEGRRISMPTGARVVHVEVFGVGSDETVWAWAIVEPGSDRVERQVAHFATGVPIPGDWDYVGTAVNSATSLVWHVFER